MPRLSNNKHSPTAKQKVFAEEYIRNKRNGTQAALVAYNTLKPRVASQIATENLSKPEVQNEIARLLAENGLELINVVKHHKRNIEQSSNLTVSQDAIDTYYEATGIIKKGNIKGDTTIIGIRVE